MSRQQQRNWRPPWEEVETRTGGYYGRPGCSTTIDTTGGGNIGGGGRNNSLGGGQRHPCEDGLGLVPPPPPPPPPRRYYGTSERQLVVRKSTHHDPRFIQQREQQRQQHYRPPEYYGGSESFDRDDGYCDLPEPLDSYGESPYVRRKAAAPYDPDNGYYPPHRPPHRPSRVPQQQQAPYSYGRQGYGDSYDRRGGGRDVVSYGVGLPVRDDDDDNCSSRGYGISPPPLTISTSSGLTLSTSSSPTDDSSNGSHDGGGGPGGSSSLADPHDGYGYARDYYRTGSPPAPPSHGGGFKSIGQDDDNDEQQPPKKRTMVELIPGVKMLLRGAAETWEAFQQRFCVAVTCVGCSAKVFCIKDADYVLCPLCRVVSPLEISAIKPSQWRVGGLGLGFTGEQDLHRSLRNKTAKLDELPPKSR